MAELSSYFRDFLANIRLTDELVGELKEAHSTLRDRLEKDEDLSKILVSTFLQGSYRRWTIVRPAEGRRVDVDVIVVTNLDRNSYTPQQALGKFREFLKAHYPDQWAYQGRSIGIALDDVDLDLVITSAPSEVAQKSLRLESVRSSASLRDAQDLRFNEFWIAPERRASLGAESWMFKANQTAEWRLEPLWIPDRDVKEWQQTHPLEQLRWTRDKNARTGGYFIKVVKALKWWRRVQEPKAEHPKSYPLERIFAECCPDDIKSVAEGVTRTLEQIVSKYHCCAIASSVPVLLDHGLDLNVLKRITAEEFKLFYESATAAAAIAREAFDEPDKPRSAKRWADLFGEEFPASPQEGDDSEGSKGGSALAGYTEPDGHSNPGSERFA